MKRLSNLRLIRAQQNVNDEYFTPLDEIEAELLLEEYRNIFFGKTVYCNCDYPESNFVKFFLEHFSYFGIKKLISTYYTKNQDESLVSEWHRDPSGNLVLRETLIPGNGDFQSEACTQLLEEADMVVTNPPFSIFSTYVSFLLEHKKEFVIIGNKNAIVTSTIIHFIMNGQVHLGVNHNNGNIFFRSGDRSICVPSYWYTSFPVKFEQKPLSLSHSYYKNPSLYSKFDNYDALNCKKIKDIPYDYFPCWYKCKKKNTCRYGSSEGLIATRCQKQCNGIIGVPITFFAKCRDNRFEVLGITDGSDSYNKAAKPILKYQKPLEHRYEKKLGRWIVSRRGARVNSCATIRINVCEILLKKDLSDDELNFTYYTTADRPYAVKLCFSRVLIRRKQG